MAETERRIAGETPRWLRVIERLERIWEKNNSPLALTGLLRDKATQRKARLFACAFCRKVWHIFWDERLTRVIEQAELYADGLISREEMVIARKAAFELVNKPLPDSPEQHWVALADASMLATHAAADDAARRMPHVIYEGLDAITSYSLPNINPTEKGWRRATRSFRKEQEVILSGFLHDIFGNPFAPTIPNPQWLTPTVTSLATSIYEERTFFERMPVLADALEDAGCTDEEVLKHCQSGGEHVRGCFVVDLILGKT